MSGKLKKGINQLNEPEVKATDTSGYAANNAAYNAADRPADGITLRCSALHSAGNSLCLGRERRGEQSRGHSDSEFLLHRRFSVSVRPAR
jgi:hypothetical protein